MGYGFGGGLGGFGNGLFRYELFTVLFLSPAYFRAQGTGGRWEHLVETYGERIDELEVQFGRYLRENWPAVRSKHDKQVLRFLDDDHDQRLEFHLDDPVRRPLGWGGARLQAWRGEHEVRLPVQDLFLTFARGGMPEWVAQVQGWPVHRMAVANNALVAHVCQTAFSGSA